LPEYCKRLIEVDLPIKRISVHARREKSIRHGHISTLHLWWARRPLAACRAVLCASLWPDPADPLCPKSFRGSVISILHGFATAVRTQREVRQLVSATWQRWNAITAETWSDETEASLLDLRSTLLDFISEFANWDAAKTDAFIRTATMLTEAAFPNARPTVLDPFAGGGAIPLEALRVGANVVASDVNPVAVLLNRIILDRIPRFGRTLANEVRRWGAIINDRVAEELREFYSPSVSGRSAATYLWARTIRCEGPACGAEVPLLRSLWLAKRTQGVALKIIPNSREHSVGFELIQKAEPRNVGTGTIRLASVTCPVCGYSTSKASVRKQLVQRRGGSTEARLIAVVEVDAASSGKKYRLPNAADLHPVARANAAISAADATLPDEDIPQERVWKNNPIRVHLYGMTKWRDLFTARQALTLAALSRAVTKIEQEIAYGQDPQLAAAVRDCLAIATSRQTDYSSSLCTWHLTRETIGHTFGRQALSMVWDYAEVCPFVDTSGSFLGAVEWIARVCESQVKGAGNADVLQADAAAYPLPDDSVSAVVTDPPYYDSVPYATLADFFYVWLKRTLRPAYPDLFSSPLIEKSRELVVDEAKGKDRAFYEKGMTAALSEARRVVQPDGLGVVVFAHKSTAGWEAVLQAVLDAGWIVTASWPIDTEMGSRLRAMNSAVLASSVHLVCRPRENADGIMRTDDIGDWRNVLQELPRRIHEWMPRLAAEGVVGADAIFACLGPALEIFSRYSRVEKASGETVTLREYLEQVWAAVAKEALALVFTDADASGFEEDARLTAMWLWTLYSAAGTEESDADNITNEESDDEDESKKPSQPRGYVLEFDAARKIAQGLGAHLDDLEHLVEIKGDKATLLSTGARARYLFGKDAGEPATGRPKKKAKQLALDFGQEMRALDDETDGEWALGHGGRVGTTTLDQLHQSMILFGAGRGEALRRLLVEEGVGRNARFWALAQALGALYPPGTDERRWVEGVQARKKGLGL